MYLDAWLLIGAVLAILFAGVLLGAALGYFTAAGDTRKERAEAWDEGHLTGVEDARRIRQHSVARGARPIPYSQNPYEEPHRAQD